MGILKIILGGLVSLTAICSLIYYFTLYPNPLSSPAVPAPAPVTVYIVVTPLPTATRVVIIRPTREPKAPKPTATPRPPKPAKYNPAAQQRWPFGKPKSTPGN